MEMDMTDARRDSPLPSSRAETPFPSSGRFDLRFAKRSVDDELFVFDF
jgi:hypothetical protein